MAKKKTSSSDKAAAVSSEDLAGTSERETETRDPDDNNPIPADETGIPLPTKEQLERRERGAL